MSETFDGTTIKKCPHHGDNVYPTICPRCEAIEQEFLEMQPMPLESTTCGCTPDELCEACWAEIQAEWDALPQPPPLTVYDDSEIPY